MTKRTGCLLIVGAIMALLASPFIAFIVHYEINSRSRTPYCDRHARSDLTACDILDERDGRILIEHADLDFNIYYFEIIDGDERREYALHPHITRLVPNGYAARLVPGEPEVIKIWFGDNDDGIDPDTVDWSEAIVHRLQPRRVGNRP